MIRSWCSTMMRQYAVGILCLRVDLWVLILPRYEGTSRQHPISHWYFPTLLNREHFPIGCSEFCGDVAHGCLSRKWMRIGGC